MSDQIRLREWSRFVFHDPEKLIRRFNELERFVADSLISDSEKALRTNELKTIRETRQAALFALGLREWANKGTGSFFRSAITEFNKQILCFEIFSKI